MIDNVIIRYEYDKDTIKEVTGTLVAVAAVPFGDFWTVDMGDTHLCISVLKIISIECKLEDYWLVPLDRIKAGFEMGDTKFHAELNQMRKTDSGFEG